MVGKNRRRGFHLLVLAILTVGTLVVGPLLTSQLTGEQSWWSRLVWIVAGIIVYFLYLWWQARSQEESPEAIKERVSELYPELRKQVQARSYGARRNLIEAPLRELDLDITPRLGWVRDPRLIEPEPISERIADGIVTAFESSKRRMLIVGEPGSGKTIAAYSLIEYLDNTEGDERMPLLVNLSAWEAQEDFEIFLVDYLCSSVGYEVHERGVARAFIGSGRYNLILDGLDEIPVRLRAHFSDRLDEFVRGLAGEVGVVVTCRTQEYKELLAAHSTGLGLVQAVEILSLSNEQLDIALSALAKLDEDWEAFLSQRDLEAGQRARGVLSNPLFLNLAVAGRLRPRQLLECDEEQEVRDLVLESYLDRTLVVDQNGYQVEDARRYLSWIARFLNGDEVSPFGLKTSDFTVFDLANLTPLDPPRRYVLFGWLGFGLIPGLYYGSQVGRGFAFASDLRLGWQIVSVVFWGLVFGLIFALVFRLVRGPLKRSAANSRLTLVWPSTRRQLLDFLRRARRGLGLGLVVGLVFGLVMGLVPWMGIGLGSGLVGKLVEGLIFGLVMGLIFGLVMGLGSGLLEPRSVLVTARTPREARSRSLISALTWLTLGLGLGLVVGLVVGLGSVAWGLAERPKEGLVLVLGFGLGFGLVLALRNGGWFVLLQRVARRRLARADNLPPSPYDFLEWGIEKQFFAGWGEEYAFDTTSSSSS